jgi:hypothetical protein
MSQRIVGEPAMNKRAKIAWLFGIAIGMLSIGCDNTPPPVIVAKKIEEQQLIVPELKPPIRPAKSDESASQLLREMIAAHTGNSPDRLEKFKVCTFTRTGIMDGTGWLPTSWTIDLAWPDRYRFRTEMQTTQDGVTLTQNQIFAMSPSSAWRMFGLTRAGQQTQEKREQVTLDPDGARTLRTQMQEDSTLLLFPLVDAKTVVARGADQTVHGQELIGLHVWTPALEYAQLSFDKKTKLLTRLIYNGREAHVNMVKELVVTEYQEFDGVKLASKLYVKANGRTLADWNKLTVTTGKPIDPKAFDTP